MPTALRSARDLPGFVTANHPEGTIPVLNVADFQPQGLQYSTRNSRIVMYRDLSRGF